jgi:hypothetical protein
MRGTRTGWRRTLLALGAVGSLVLLVAPVGGVASTSLECRFQGPGYPKLGRHSKPGNKYGVFVRRSLTCDEARAVARRGTKTANPGPFRPFTLQGGWSCLSWSPGFVATVIAGQCVKPGTRALVNWSPICDSRDRSCSTLRRSP